MKKFLAMAVLCLVALAACSPEEKVPEVTGTLSITSPQQLEFLFVGGEGEITYAIQGGADGAQPTVSCAQEWVTNFSVAETITFNVERSTVAEARIAILFIRYGDQEEQVFVKQEAAMVADVEYVAKTLNGEYYGNDFSSGYNYFVVLSEKGTTGFSDMYVDTYYRLDLYSNVPHNDGSVMLPKGTYIFDPYSLGESGSIGYEYTVRLQPMADGNLTEDYFTNGIVIVGDDVIEAYLELEKSGEVHHVIYEGALELSYVEIPEPDYYSYLTEDYSFNHTGGIMRLFYYGDYYNLGAANWSVTAHMGDPINGDYFMIDFVAGSDSYDVNSVYGTYTCVADEQSVAKNTFIAGDMQDRQMVFSWYKVCEDNYVINASGAPIVGGSIEILNDGDNYLLKFDCVDDLGYKIQGTYSCSELEMYDQR